MVISNHFLCKGLVHHPTETIIQLKQEKTSVETPEFTNMTGWKIPKNSMGNTWKYIIHGGFSIVMLVFGGCHLIFSRNPRFSRSRTWMFSQWMLS